MAFPRYSVLTCRVCWVAEVTGTTPAGGWAGGGSGGGVCGLAAVVVEPPQDGDVAALRGYSYLHMPRSEPHGRGAAGDEGGGADPHGNGRDALATRNGVHGYHGWLLPSGCGLDVGLTCD